MKIAEILKHYEKKRKSKIDKKDWIVKRNIIVYDNEVNYSSVRVK